MSERSEKSGEAILRYPLCVYIVGLSDSTIWTKSSSKERASEGFATELFRYLSFDINNPTAANPAIPVFFHFGDFAKQDPPPAIDVCRARNTIVIILFDPGFFNSTDQWRRYFVSTIKQAEIQGAYLTLIPIASEEDGRLGSYSKQLGLGGVLFRTTPSYGNHYEDVEDRNRYLRTNIASAVYKVLRDSSTDISKDPDIKLFLSYAKSDGEEISHRISEVLNFYPGISPFVDSKAISFGSEINSQTIKGSMANASCVIICRTTRYSSRYWCRRETLIAREHNIPIIVVDAFDNYEQRGIPYTGNCPAVRWRASSNPQREVETFLELVLGEMLRFVYHNVRCATLVSKAPPKSGRVHVVSRPPDPLTVLELASKRNPSETVRDIVLYPDPPLSEDELETLRSISKDVLFYTPTNFFRYQFSSSFSG